MTVLGLIFLRYAYSRLKLVEAEILKECPISGGRVLPVEASDFASRSDLSPPLGGSVYLSGRAAGEYPSRRTAFSDELLAELLRIFNNSALDEVGGDIIGRIYKC